jgi:prepilin-type N-terminal cleavage/methylation domain-containing protein
MHKRLKAFTLLELLVAMAITGIVISISGLVYNMTGRQFSSYRETSRHISSVFALNSRIAADFNDASSIERDEAGLRIERMKKSPVQYNFTTKAVLRTEVGRTDTLHIKTEHVQFKFRSEPQEKGLVDELSFKAVVMEEQESLHFIRQYGICTELNKEETHGH